MERHSRKLPHCVTASLLGLAGVLLCLAGATFPAGAQDSRVLQVWPDLSTGVTSGPSGGAEVYTATQLLPFGVCYSSTGGIVHARTYLHFPLDVFPPGTEVKRAVLYAYVDSSSGTGEATVGAYRVLEPWDEENWSGGPATWPALLTVPIATTIARFDVLTPTLPVSTPVPTATPTLTPTPTPTPTLTATETSRLFSKPAGHGLVQGTTATVAIDPSSSQVSVGGTTTVAIRVEDVNGLSYAEVYRLAFDPDLLEVVDDAPGADGVQIQPGAFLGQDPAEDNLVDQENGEIDFLQEALEDPVSGSGVLAVITFRGKAVGESYINLSEEEGYVYLWDDEGEEITAEFQQGSLTIITSGETPEPTTEPTNTPAPGPTETSTPGPTATSPTSPLPTSTSGPTPTSSTTPSPTPTPTSTSTPTPISTPGSTPTSPASPLPTPTASLPPTVLAVSLGQAAGTWLTWDVTALMRAWMAREVRDDGLALAPAPDPDAGPETAGDLLVARWLTAKDPHTRPHIIVEFEVHPVTPTPVPVLPPAGSTAGWGSAGLLLVGAALLILGLVRLRK